ncbi:phage tail tape measure protein [Escherichia coli]|nr:phage tail tape measure protein [Escherichia coli]
MRNLGFQPPRCRPILKRPEMAAKDWAESEASRLKYTEEAQKAYERLQTPLEKYTARQEELNKALKDGKILQADYNTLMATAKRIMKRR